MKDEKKYTERDKVMFLREGYRLRMAQTSICTASERMHHAAHAFPLPKRVVPRVVKDVPGWEEFKFRVVDRKFEVTGVHAECWIIQPLSSESTFRDLGPVYASLLATPTEEVEDA